MQDPASANENLSELERQLAALAPTCRVDRDRLMYAAGRRAGRRHLRATQRWLAVTSAGFGAMLAFVTLSPSRSIDLQPDAPAAIAERPEVDVLLPSTARFDQLAGDPAANFRLLQELASGAAWDSPSFIDGDVSSGDPEADDTRNDSRGLLHRYLNDPRTRL